jgi:hypothetical protein
MPVKRQLLFTLLFLCSGIAFGQRIEFFREELVFTIDSCCFSVNGDYFFRNPSRSGVNYTVFYPVSSVQGQPAIDTILVYDVSNPGHPLKVAFKDSVASFSLSFLPSSEKCVKIFYRQHHNHSSARYILMTTHQWHQPLEMAKYSLVTGKEVFVTHFSITPDRSEEFEQTRLYYWTRKQFMPDVDFLFGIGKGEK